MLKKGEIKKMTLNRKHCLLFLVIFVVLLLGVSTASSINVEKNNSHEIIDNKVLSAPDNYDVDKEVQSGTSPTSTDAYEKNNETSDNTNNTEKTNRQTINTQNTVTTETTNDITSKNISLEKTIKSNVKTDGETAVYSFSNLVSRIENSEDTLLLPENTIFRYNGDEDSDYINGITITKNITIKCINETSYRTVIDGNNQARIFNLVGENLVIHINNIELINGNSSNCVNKNGGAIVVNITGDMIVGNQFNALVNLTQITIKNSYSPSNGGGAYLASPTAINGMSYINNTANNGGAIYVDCDGDRNYPNYNFNLYNNTAYEDGGALYIKGNHLGIVNVNFNNNTAGKNGGAAYWEGYDGGLMYTYFFNNTAKRSGGGLYWRGENGTLNRSTFIGNNATGIVNDTVGGGDGGAIMWIGSNGNVDISTFRRNYAEFRGGAIFLEAHDQYQKCENITISNSIFDSNEAGTNGGAIDWFEGASFGYVLNSNFTNNIANRAAGAINWQGSNGTISDCLFENNTAKGIKNDSRNLVVPEKSKTKGGNGGAVLWIGSDGLLYNNTFNNNYAHVYGGALFIRDNDNVTIRLSKFNDNGANQTGGAINFYNGSSNAKIYDSEFKNNYANRSGGALSWFGTNGGIYNATFINNTATATSNPSGIDSSMYWIKVTPYDQNNNTGDGGAILWLGDNGEIINCTFADNVAKRSGGSIYWQGSVGEIINSNFTNSHALGKDIENTTGGDGGAVIWTGSNGNVTDSIFTNNSAAYRGGAVYFTKFNSTTDSENNTVKGSIFTNNTAGLNGGAVNFYGGSIRGTVENSTFEDNFANRSAGAVYWRGEYGSIIDCKFNNNSVDGSVNNDTRLDKYIEMYPDKDIDVLINETGLFKYKIEGGNGGAVNWHGTNGEIYNTLFTNNRAITETNNNTGKGGAIYILNNENMTIYNCTFDNNIARLVGGAVGINISANYTKILNSNFTNNKAIGYNDSGWVYGEGGAVHFGAGSREGIINNSTFINNTAFRYAGAVEWNGLNGLINSSTFRNNSATFSGGAVRFDGNNGNISSSKFYNNTANSTGGALRLDGHNA
ncbi:MAG: hypothetical protein BZ138_01375, partial [Methanosphaera sp. rholeuAM270]